MNATSAAPVMILAGGTGGHIFPGIAVAEALAARAVFGAVRVLRREAPRSVVAFGGFAAGPGGLAAWLLRRPLLVHEQNRIPGITNRVLSRLARRVLAGFPDAFGNERGEWVGNPVRREIAALPPPAQRFAGRDGAPRLLVLGGSQGARALNTALPAALKSLGMDINVRHQCGERLRAEAEAAYRDAGINASVESFIDDMAAAYGWADLVVCRAGALTLAELASAGCGALLVPFPAAVDDHQTRNAEFFVQRGAAERLPEGPDLAERLQARLRVLLADRGALLRMAEAARRLRSEDAADVVARACIEEAAR